MRPGIDRRPEYLRTGDQNVTSCKFVALLIGQFADRDTVALDSLIEDAIEHKDRFIGWIDSHRSRPPSIALTVPNFLVERIGQHQSFIARFESGQHRIDVVELLDIAEAIGFDPRAALSRLKSVRH